MRRTPLLFAAAALSIAPLAACGGGSDKADEPAGSGSGTEVVAKGSDALKWDKSSYEAKAGSVSFKLVTEGQTAHTLLVKQGDDVLPGMELSTAGRKSGSLNLQAGTYTVFCDVAGHGNMHAELTVK